MSHAVTRQPTLDEELGVAWWNSLREADRRIWLDTAGSAVPADAWACFKAHALDFIRSCEALLDAADAAAAKGNQ